MGTTLVAGFFTPTQVTFVNVGDSRAYRIAKDGIVRITKDHSLVQEMVDSGQLTPAQARRHPHRNIITRAVGSEAFVTCDVFELPIREGDSFLLCSDGLSNAVEEAELHRLVLASEDPENACRSLIHRALENNARDNVTAIVIGTDGKGGAA
jgi:protein phosphatase